MFNERMESLMEQPQWIKDEQQMSPCLRAFYERMILSSIRIFARDLSRNALFTTLSMAMGKHGILV